MNKGAKDAKSVDFQRYMESRLKYDLAQKTEAIFDEIWSACSLIQPTPRTRSMSAPIGFQQSQRISLGAVEDFAESAFGIRLDLSQGGMEKVFERFGGDKGLLTHIAFEDKVMNVRTIAESLKIGN